MTPFAAAPRGGCPGCGDCCRTVRVPLTHRDLERLTAATGLDAAAHAEWLGPDEIDMTGEPETFVRLRAGRRLLVLRHLGGGCCHLVGDRCAVYPARPLACAAFPHDVAEAGAAAPTVIALAGAPCVLGAPADEASVLDRVRALRAELAEYAALVGAWNQRQRRRQRLGRLPEPTERFFAHLARACSEADATPAPAPVVAGSAGSRASDPR